MKFAKIAVLSMSFGLISSMCLAEAYGNGYDEYNSYYRTSEYGQYVPNIRSYNTTKQHTNTELPVHFFVGLGVPLLKYSKISASATEHDYKEEHTETKINNNIFENINLNLGVDTDSGFRVSFAFSHNNKEDKINNTNTEISQTNIGLALDIPFVKKEKTSPFIRLGIEHIASDNDELEMKASGFGYFAGLGVAHNFSKNIFGILSATYAFGKPDVDVSGVDISYKEDCFTINMGLGYRF